MGVGGGEAEEVACGEEDLVAEGVDAGLAAPYGCARPGGVWREGGDVPFCGEGVGVFVEGQGYGVADEGAAFVGGEEEGCGFLEGGGAD